MYNTEHPSYREASWGLRRWRWSRWIFAKGAWETCSSDRHSGWFSHGSPDTECERRVKNDLQHVTTEFLSRHVNNTYVRQQLLRDTRHTPRQHGMCNVYIIFFKICLCSCLCIYVVKVLLNFFHIWFIFLRNINKTYQKNIRFVKLKILSLRNIKKIRPIKKINFQQFDVRFHSTSRCPSWSWSSRQTRLSGQRSTLKGSMWCRCMTLWTWRVRTRVIHGRRWHGSAW